MTNKYLIHLHSYGSLASLLTTDAITKRIYEIKAMQLAKLKVSTLFLKTKVGFHHVLKQSLASLFATKSELLYLIH